METAAGLIRLKPGSGADLQDWRDTLHARRGEVLQTLRNEGVTVESWFQVDIDGDPYLLWFMQAESIAKAQEVFLASNYEIDAYHLGMMMKMAEARIDAQPLLDLAPCDPARPGQTDGPA